LKANAKKRSVQTQFDANEYIEHIEKELQQARDEAYSPLTRRPMKEKLRAANKENERLLKELAQLREKFETDVKRTVEHKTVAEVELKRRVRDLEDSLEAKDNTIRELQYQYEERRLDTNVIDSLKASIERLEQDKLDMDEINLSMSKRNEVLTQLLAMSPTKTLAGFNLGSPTKEKRNARPLSLILPRLPPSPNARQLTKPKSLAGSPQPMNRAEISPFKLSPEDGWKDQITSMPRNNNDTTKQQDVEIETRPLQSPSLRANARRWTMYSDVSAASGQSNDEPRAAPRRKARKFVAGSTQLKPLLLPTLTGETMSMSSASTASSPLSWSINPYFEADAEDTILAGERSEEPFSHSLLSLDISDAGSVISSGSGAGGPGPVYASDDNDAPEDEAKVRGSENDVVLSSDHKELALPKTSHFDILTLEDDANEAQYPADSAKSSPEYYPTETGSRTSLQTMPMPSTPDYLAILPRPLFSPAHRDERFTMHDQDCGPPSASPQASLQGQINMRKRRKSSFNISDHGSPVPKLRRRRRRHSSVHEIPHAIFSPVPPVAVNPSSGRRNPPTKLQHVRSCDNFVEVLRQKNFAAKPLAAMTIKTVFKILATCTSVIRDVRRDPFALARCVLANAWYMNWKMLGKVSWWVLGLFVSPKTEPKAQQAIDWDKYDGESIASRYCCSQPYNEPFEDSPMVRPTDDQPRSDFERIEDEYRIQQHDSVSGMSSQRTKPGWGQSLFLWGKFSAAMMLAVGGAVIQGPGEMLKDVPLDRPSPSSRHHLCRSCGNHRTGRQLRQFTPSTGMLCSQRQSMQCLDPDPTRETTYIADISDFDLRNESQLNSSSFLDQIQQPSYDSTHRPEHHGRGQVDSLFSPAPSFDRRGLELYCDDKDDDSLRMRVHRSQEPRTPGHAHG